MWLAALLTLAAPDAAAQDACQEIRNVRALAVRDGLDDRTLRRLEATYCGGGHADRPHPGRPPVGAVSADCRSLQLMEWLQTIGGGRKDQLEAISAKRSVACTMNADQGRRTWDNGLTLKSTSGAWSYPTGLTAISTSGALSYPNGLTARSSSGSWSYPNGLTARSASGRWSRPDGLSVGGEQDLVGWACSQNPADCDWYVQRIAQLDGQVREMAIVAMAWRASGK